MVTNYESLINEDHVDLVFGPVSSLLTVPAARVAARYGYAFIEPAGGAPTVFALHLHNLFLSQPAPVLDLGVSFADYILSLPPGQRPKTAAYSSVDNPFASPVVEVVRQRLQAAGIKTVLDQTYPAEQADLGPVVARVVAVKPDLVVDGTQGEDGYETIRDFVQQKFSPKILFMPNDASDPVNFPAQVGLGNVDGIFTADDWSPMASRPGNADFIKAYLAAYGGTASQIDPTSAEAYACGQLLAGGRAEDRQGSTTPRSSRPCTRGRSTRSRAACPGTPTAPPTAPRACSCSGSITSSSRSTRRRTPRTRRECEAGLGRVTAVHTFLQALILGILTGGVYALMSTGQTLVFGVMRVVNVAQGMLVILSAYLSYTVHQDLGIDPFLTLVIVMPAMFAVGVGIQLLFIRPVKRNRTDVSFEQTLLIMFALAVGIEGILDLVYTSEYRSITTTYANSSWTVLGYTVSVVRVLAFALAVALLAALWVVLNKTSFGRAVRATVQNPTSARLLGVDTERIGALGMGLGISLAGAAGAVFGLIYPFNANSSYDLVSRLLSIIVLGGLGSVVGAVVGSLSLGVAEAVVAAMVSPVWAPFTFLVVLMAVLLVRPQGIFGAVERGAL